MNTLESLHDKKILHDQEKAVCSLLAEEGAPPHLTALLSLASRSGHLCIAVKKDSILPPLEQLLGEGVDSREPETQAILNEFVTSAIIEASSFSSTSTITSKNISGLNTFAFRSSALLEEQFVSELKRLFSSPPTLVFSLPDIQTGPNQEHRNGLNKEQVEAVLTVLSESCTWIIGGPGTGKSTVAAKLLQILDMLLTTHPLKRSLQVILAAPTGKAAANLEEKLQKTPLKQIHIQSSSTLHALLGIRKDRPEETSLDADLILVDECSMIDAQLMVALLKRIKSGARLLMLGDSDQLPPVEAGSLFTDSLAFLRNSGFSKHICQLKQCMRAERESLLHLAEAVRTNSKTTLITQLKKNQPELIWRNKDAEESLEEIFKEALTLYRKADPHNLANTWALFQSHRILTPLKKGPCGVETLNKTLASLLEQHAIASGASHWIAPILATKNNDRLNIFNGDSGLLLRSLKNSSHNSHLLPTDELLFPTATGWQTLSATLLPHVSFGYTLSIHKSQGSEADEVALLLPKASLIFGKEILYTGITRAKKKLSIYGSEYTLTQLLTQTSRKLSTLSLSYGALCD